MTSDNWGTAWRAAFVWMTLEGHSQSMPIRKYRTELATWAMRASLQSWKTRSA